MLLNSSLISLTQFTKWITIYRLYTQEAWLLQLWVILSQPTQHFCLAFQSLSVWLRWLNQHLSRSTLSLGQGWHSVTRALVHNCLSFSYHSMHHKFFPPLSSLLFQLALQRLLSLPCFSQPAKHGCNDGFICHYRIGSSSHQWRRAAWVFLWGQNSLSLLHRRPIALLQTTEVMGDV